MAEQQFDTLVMEYTGERDAQDRNLALEFTGSGSEYFRIWIVNMLLILVTLGLYYPWAKVRRLRYFHGNTLIGGEPLGFHGDPKKMFKGYVLVALLFGCYSLAREFRPSASFVALLLVAALWPALFKSSLQFRLANTSWRGLRFRFSGSLSGAYKATLPLWAPAALIVGITALLSPSPQAQALAAKWIGVIGLVSALSWPWLLWNLKKYQHENYALGAQQTGFSASVGSFYMLSLRAVGIYILCGVLVAACLGVGLAGFTQLVFNATGAKGNDPKSVLSALFWIVIAGFSIYVVVYAYVIARAQDLIWNHTASSDIQIFSHLHFSSLLWLTLKNWLLIVITLGLYLPFAAVAVRRLRLQAVTVALDISPRTLFAERRHMDGDAAGDAAGDFFGFDIGL